MVADLRHLVRNLRRSPASAAAAVLTLSLTLGAGASIFAVVDAVVLTPPPVTDPGALVVLAEIPAGNAAASPRAAAYSTFEEWRARAAPLASMEAFDGTNLTLTELGAAERLQAMNVTTGFLALLGASPALGRTFAPEDDGLPLVVISHAFWRSRLGGAQSAVGQQIVLGGQPHTVVGVLPERFTFGLETADLWRPFPAAPGTAARAASRVSVVARLGAARVAADLAAVLDEVSGRATPPSRVIATPFATAVSGRARAPLAILAGAAAFALFVAFTNLAGLLMVRAMDRRRELAVRTALGARRFEIARQLLLEALVLAAAGVAGGLLLALWTTPAVGQLAIEQFGGSANRAVEVNGRGIATVSLLAFVCAGFCGAAPAFAASRPDVVDVLRRGATAPPRDRRLRRVLVAGEVAVAFVLLVSLALLGRSLLTVSRTNPGFDPEDVLTLQVSLPSAHYDSAVRVTGFYASLRAALTERLGAGSASIVDEIPLSGGRGVTLVSAGPTQAGLEAMVRSADVAYFDVMRIPILSGRGFDLTDTPSAPPRAVISESLASALFPGESPIGRRVRLRPPLQTADIIGVVGDVRQRALDEPPTPAVYLPGTQAPSNSSIVVVRSQRPDGDVTTVVRAAVAQLDASLPVYSVRPMTAVIARSSGVPVRRLLTAAFSAFALLAVVLSTVGLFGLAAHDVARRRSEIALRIALGAAPARILRATLGHGTWTIIAGLAAGVVLAIWAVGTLSAAFPSTGRLDVLSAVLAAAVLLTTGLCAALPAALRASRTDPLKALRSE